MFKHLSKQFNQNGTTFQKKIMINFILIYRKKKVLTNLRAQSEAIGEIK